MACCVLLCNARVTGYQRGWALFRPDEGWERSLSDGWNRSAIDELVSSRFPKLVKQVCV